MFTWKKKRDKFGAYILPSIPSSLISLKVAPEDGDNTLTLQKLTRNLNISPTRVMYSFNSKE